MLENETSNDIDFTPEALRMVASPGTKSMRQTWNRMGWTTRQGMPPASPPAAPRTAEIAQLYEPERPRTTWNRLEKQNEPAGTTSEAATPTPRQTGNQKAMDFPTSLKQEQEKLGTLESRGQRAQKMSARTSEMVARHRGLIASVVAGMLCLSGFIKLCGLETSKQKLKLAQAQLDGRNFEEAIGYLDQAIFFDHEAFDAYVLRAQCYENRGDRSLAYEDLNRALESQPDNTQVLLADSRLASALGFTDRVLDDLTRLEGKDAKILTQTPDTLINYSAAYLKKGEVEYALGEIKECLRHHPHCVEALVQRAMCYEQAGNFSLALTDCGKAEQLERSYAPAWIEQGTIYEGHHDLSNALKSFTKAIDANPKLVSGYSHRSVVYMKLNQTESAINDLNKAIMLDNSAKYYLARAAVLTTAGDYKSALADYNRVDALSTFHADASYFEKRSAVKEKLNDLKGALSDLRMAASGSPLSTSLLLRQADLLVAMKDYKASRTVLQQVLNSEPQNSIALYKESLVCDLEGNHITALADLCKAIQADPKNVQAYLKRADTYMATKQFETAAQDLRQALRINPSLPDATEKLKTCMRETHKVIVTAPRSSVVRERVGLSKAQQAQIAAMSQPELLQKGYEALQNHNVDYALAALTRAVRLKPNDKNARKYLFYALVAGQQGQLATTQLYALEKLGGELIGDELSMAKSIYEAGDSEQARTVMVHLISRYGTSPLALQAVAQQCNDLSMYAESRQACDRALDIGADKESTKMLRAIRDVAIEKGAVAAPKPVEMSIYKGGDGEANQAP